MTQDENNSTRTHSRSRLATMSMVRGDARKKVASTTTLFEVVVAGGRAIDALRSVTVAQHLFGIQRVDIDTEALSLVVEDTPASTRRGLAASGG
jgi:hypothetical protein